MAASRGVVRRVFDVLACALYPTAIALVALGSFLLVTYLLDHARAWALLSSLAEHAVLLAVCFTAATPPAPAAGR